MKRRVLAQAVGIARRIGSSRRAHVAIGTNGLSSVGNFSVSIAIARYSPLDEVGVFALAMSVYSIAVGVVRASVAEPLLAGSLSRESLARGLRQASALGMLAAAAVGIVGVTLGSTYFIAIGLALHGLCIYEYVKIMHLGGFQPHVALRQELAWAVCALAASLAVVGGWFQPEMAFAAWALSGGVIGYASTALQRLGLVPSWRRGPVDSRVAAGFGLDFMLGSGSALVALNAVSLAAGTAVVGALRAAGTLFGPVGLLLASARTLLIPYLGRIVRLPLGVLRASAVTGAVMAVLALPLVLAIGLLPDPAGVLLLGPNWQFAKPLLPFLALELLFAVAASVAFAAHKAMLASRRTLRVRAALAFVRVTGVVGGAVAGGALGAAAAMAAMGLLSLIVWWTSYASAHRNWPDMRRYERD